MWPDRGDEAERTGRGTNVNTARLCFGNGERKAFHQLNESPKCSCELQANMAEYCVCGQSGGRSVSVSMETSWGVLVYAAWSPRTLRGRPPPEDWESSRLRFEKRKRYSRGREEGGRKEGKELGGAQWAPPSSKDSTPESQVLAASFSCRLLMISCSSEPALFWRRRRNRDMNKHSSGHKRTFDLRRLSSAASWDEPI